MKKTIVAILCAGIICLLVSGTSWSQQKQAVTPTIAKGCPDLDEFTYWVDVFDDGGTGVMNYRLNACKMGPFNYCDITLQFKVTGINAHGNTVVTYHTIWIAKNQNCGQARIGYTWREVTDVELIGRTCSNCTYPPTQP